MHRNIFRNLICDFTIPSLLKEMENLGPLQNLANDISLDSKDKDRKCGIYCKLMTELNAMAI